MELKLLKSWAGRACGDAASMQGGHQQPANSHVIQEHATYTVSLMSVKTVHWLILILSLSTAS